MRNYWSVNKWQFTQSIAVATVFDVDFVDDRPGMVVLRVRGDGASQRFANESGGHRWQRIPPTERGGRVHSSTITVAVMREGESADIEIRESDCEFQACRSSGPGGQNVNKVSSAVQVWHKPSGLTFKVQSERSQHQNKANAKKMLHAKLSEQKRNADKNRESQDRKQQVGSGERSDKIRTVQMKNNVVVNHLTGKKISTHAYLKGEVERIA